MTDCHSTASPANPGNILYPSCFKRTVIHAIAEDADEYAATENPIHLSCEALTRYIKHRLEERKELPVRLHGLLDDLSLLLRQRDEVDVFDLLVELILLADREPARHLSALLAVLSDEALIELEPGTIAGTGAFLHDALQQDVVRWYLQNYHEEKQ